MRQKGINRRKALKALGATAGAAFFQFPASAKQQSFKASPPFIYSLNMSSIRGQKLGFIKELQTASKAGFRHVEIWIDTYEKYLQQGGTPREARSLIKDLGLEIENAIGFAKWIVDDEDTRLKGLEQLKREMGILAEIGCKRIAAPPMGANNASATLIDLDVVVKRYLAILYMGKQTGVLPILEMWGSSTNLKKISQVLYVVTECGDKNARVLLDTFHIFKGGSSFDSVAFVGSAAMDIMHLNDYPAGIPPEKISEPDRIYPGDGVAPLRPMLATLAQRDQPLILSMEVFNESYYRQDALLVARTALAKMKAVAEGL